MQSFSISPLRRSLEVALREKIDQKTKPLGALGQLESIALQVGLVQNTPTPVLKHPVMMVFAGDHGIVAEGVSPYPQEVTHQMVLNFLTGGAGINVFAKQAGMQVRVVDAGVNHTFPAYPHLIDVKVGMGTRNFAHEPAMDVSQAETAIARGARLVHHEVGLGTNVFGFGEMGIANTSSAAVLMAILTDTPIAQCVGRGTGLDDAGLIKKTAVLEKAMLRHGTLHQDPLQVLATYGGFEIAMMVGAMLGAAEARALLLIDGFISTAALLVAARLCPSILEYCVFAHCSDETGHARLLAALNATPLLRLNMRLGEGTGAALAFGLVQSSVAFLNEMASFASANVSHQSADA